MIVFNLHYWEINVTMTDLKRRVWEKAGELSESERNC